MSVIANDIHLKIGGLIFPDMDQCDFTGPFEALARVPNSTFYTIWKNKQPVRDMRGMQLLPDTTIAEAPQLDVLLVPRRLRSAAVDGRRSRARIYPRAGSKCALCVFGVYRRPALRRGRTIGRKTRTTHWTAMEVLPYFGATPSDDRVVVDGRMISAGGVTSGIDGSLIVASLLRGDAIAQELQLYMVYDPQPPFNAGSPKTAPADVVRTLTQRAQPILEQRLQTARAYQQRKNK